MPCRLIVATAFAAGMSVALLGCTGGPAQTAISSAPVAGPTEGSPMGAPAGQFGGDVAANAVSAVEK